MLSTLKEKTSLTFILPKRYTRGHLSKKTKILTCSLLILLRSRADLRKETSKCLSFSTWTIAIAEMTWLPLVPVNTDEKVQGRAKSGLLGNICRRVTACIRDRTQRQRYRDLSSVISRGLGLFHSYGRESWVFAKYTESLQRRARDVETRRTSNSNSDSVRLRWSSSFQGPKTPD